MDKSQKSFTVIGPRTSQTHLNDQNRFPLFLDILLVGIKSNPRANFLLLGCIRSGTLGKQARQGVALALGLGRDRRRRRGDCFSIVGVFVSSSDGAPEPGRQRSFSF